MQKRSEKSHIYADALAEIEKRHGKLTPDLVVAEARSEEHVLHKEFEWNDSDAAIQWRLTQAREIIRAARIEVTVREVSFSTFAYVRDPLAPPNEQGYVGVRQLSTDQATSIEAVASEIRQAAALLRRARDVAMALGIDVDPIQKLEESAGSLATSLSSSVVAAENAA